MRPPRGWMCQACGGMSKFAQTRCFMCGSYLDAMQLLFSHGVNPSEIHKILGGSRDYVGITMYVANTVIEVIREDHNEPH